MLKSDFHMHSKEDWHDFYHISYSAKDLIREAARQKFEVLSITHHNHVYDTPELRSYAKKQGILLIPGAEVFVEGKDILLLNVSNDEIQQLKRIRDLRKLNKDALVVAPHPYFFTSTCLADKLEENIEFFDAIEYSHYYNKLMMHPPFRLINGNLRALETAKKHKIPLIGTSDAHRMYELGSTFSWVDSEKDKDAVLDAIRKGKVDVESRPMPLHLFLRRTAGILIYENVMMRFDKRLSRIPPVHRDPHFKRFK